MSFNPPVNDNFDRVERTIEVLYTGVKILGHKHYAQVELAENMTRPFADTH
jgi:Zn-dependent oligopeptidase